MLSPVSVKVTRPFEQGQSGYYYFVHTGGLRQCCLEAALRRRAQKSAEERRRAQKRFFNHGGMLGRFEVLEVFRFSTSIYLSQFRHILFSHTYILFFRLPDFLGKLGSDCFL